MIEIRICWEPAIDPEHEGECVGPWLPFTPFNQEMFEALAVNGADGYGDGTHWIERR